MFKMRFLRSSECLKTTLNSPEQPLELIQNFATVTKIHTKHTKHTNKKEKKLKKRGKLETPKKKRRGKMLLL